METRSSSSASTAAGDKRAQPLAPISDASQGSTRSSGLSQAPRAVQRRQQRNRPDQSERLINLMEAAAEAVSQDGQRLINIEERLLHSQEMIVEQGNQHLAQFAQALAILGQIVSTMQKKNTAHEVMSSLVNTEKRDLYSPRLIFRSFRAAFYSPVNRVECYGKATAISHLDVVFCSK